MRKVNKRVTLQSQSQQYGKLPIINHSQFSSKLNDLLDKISIQNRYASRISHSNMKNLTELEQARAELRRIADEKKMEQLNATDTNQMIQQMANRVKDSETELEKLFKEIIQARKDIKHLKQTIIELQNDNLQLQKQVLQEKREKFHDICQARHEMDPNLLTTHIATFLLESSRPNTLLYRYCFNAHKTNSYEGFFTILDKQMQREMRLQASSQFSCSNEPGGTPKLKLKIPKPILSNVNKIYERYKTEHCERMKVKQSKQS